MFTCVREENQIHGTAMHDSVIVLLFQELFQHCGEFLYTDYLFLRPILHILLNEVCKQDVLFRKYFCVGHFEFGDDTLVDKGGEVVSVFLFDQPVLEYTVHFMHPQSHEGRGVGEVDTLDAADALEDFRDIAQIEQLVGLCGDRQQRLEDVILEGHRGFHNGRALVFNTFRVVG